MKDRKREVIEELVAFNLAEVEFLLRLTNQTDEILRVASGPCHATRALVERVHQKLSSAQERRWKKK